MTLTHVLTNHGEAELETATVLPQIRKARVNFKNSLTVLSRHFEAPLLQQTQFLTDIINDMLDSIRVGRYRQRLNSSFERHSKHPVGKWNRGRPKNTSWFSCSRWVS